MFGLNFRFKKGFYNKIRERIELPHFQFSTIIDFYLSDGSSTLSYVRSLFSKLKVAGENYTNASFNFKKSFERFDYFGGWFIYLVALLF